jgi:hypothetical protein
MTQFKEKELSLKNLFRIFVFKQEYGRIKRNRLADLM